MRSAAAGSEVDGLRHHFNALIMAYAPLRAGAAVSSEPHDPWGERLLTLLQERLDRGPGPAASATVAAPARRRRVLFLSGVPGSPGHVYRVEHSLEALRQGDWRGDWCSLEDPELTSRINEVSLVCVFRTPWSPRLADVASICRARRIPLVADIDGLIFDRALLEQGRLAYVEQLPRAERERWCLRADDYRTTLSQADAVIVNTAPLAAAAARVNPRVHLLSNGLSPAMLGAADRHQGQGQAELAAHEPRLGFASGTPSHKLDFAVVAEPLARLLERHPRLRLVLVGEIEPGDYPCLRPHATRIERRPRVPLRDLHAEVSRFTINLAPLEPDNPFCEAKSPIRVTTAAAVGVVSVASPTAPLRDALLPGHSGLLAASPAEWETAIEELLLQPGRRQSMAEAARRDVICRFGWPDWAEQARCVYATILAEFSTASGGIHIASP
jgi:glycosyltransferase involved in cell wall biosynthesis